MFVILYNTILLCAMGKNIQTFVLHALNETHIILQIIDNIVKKHQTNISLKWLTN